MNKGRETYDDYLYDLNTINPLLDADIKRQFICLEASIFNTFIPCRSSG